MPAPNPQSDTLDLKTTVQDPAPRLSVKLAKIIAEKSPVLAFSATDFIDYCKNKTPEQFNKWLAEMETKASGQRFTMRWTALETAINFIDARESISAFENIIHFAFAQQSKTPKAIDEQEIKRFNVHFNQLFKQSLAQSNPDYLNILIDAARSNLDIAELLLNKQLISLLYHDLPIDSSNPGSDGLKNQVSSLIATLNWASIDFNKDPAKRIQALSHALFHPKMRLKDNVMHLCKQTAPEKSHSFLEKQKSDNNFFTKGYALINTFFTPTNEPFITDELWDFAAEFQKLAIKHEMGAKRFANSHNLNLTEELAYRGNPTHTFKTILQFISLHEKFAAHGLYSMANHQWSYQESHNLHRTHFLEQIVISDEYLRVNSDVKSLIQKEMNMRSILQLILQEPEIRASYHQHLEQNPTSFTNMKPYLVDALLASKDFPWRQWGDTHHHNFLQACFLKQDQNNLFVIPQNSLTQACRVIDKYPEEAFSSKPGLLSFAENVYEALSMPQNANFKYDKETLMHSILEHQKQKLALAKPIVTTPNTTSKTSYRI